MPEPQAKEAGILKIELNGSETCELSPSTSFVQVSVPIRIVGEGAKGEATYHYSIGAFLGRDTTLALRAELQTTLRFRIPLELFRSRERFAVEVRADSSTGSEQVLWTERWEVTWLGKIPSLEPMAD
jgi:hypothetical protein